MNKHTLFNNTDSIYNLCVFVPLPRTTIQLFQMRQITLTNLNLRNKYYTKIYSPQKTIKIILQTHCIHNFPFKIKKSFVSFQWQWHCRTPAPTLTQSSCHSSTFPFYLITTVTYCDKYTELRSTFSSSSCWPDWLSDFRDELDVSRRRTEHGLKLTNKETASFKLILIPLSRHNQREDSLAAGD